MGYKVDYVVVNVCEHMVKDALRWDLDSVHYMRRTHLLNSTLTPTI